LGDATFYRATFRDDAGFERAMFQHDARFQGTTFHRARQLGPVLVRKGLVLDDAVFHERAQIQVSAAALCCRRTRFLAGVVLRVRWAQIALGLADLAAPSVLADARAFPGLEEGRWARALERLRPSDMRGSRPRLLAVRRADVAGLVLSGVDLRACRFAGAHHLDRLHIEESDFAFTPKGWRWTTRQTIAEEHHWRATHPPRPFSTRARTGHDTAAIDARRRQAGRSGGWYGPANRPPAWLETIPPDHVLPALPTPPPSAAQIAVLYRSLRKGREDNKDEPGAADFYYGEMEMRRHATPRFSAEWAVLTLHWLVSGYALRAWRALAALTAVLVLAAWLLVHHGFAAPPAMTFWGALRYLGRTAIGLLPKDQLALTPSGDVLQIAVRVIVPVLLGLAVFSIRGRVKR
jgi:hypothetical protein